MINLKTALKNNKLTLGSWISLYNASIAEIMARAGFEWLAVDMEHSSITFSQAQQLIQTIELSSVVPLVRLSENNAVMIKRAMDAGAHGVIVPMVNSREDAQTAVDSVKYPPQGKRGVGLYRAQGYGFNFKGYKNWLTKESVVIVQIEHIEAINNLHEILSVPGVDGSIIGPYDLSASLGRPGEFDAPEVKEAIKAYESCCKKLKKTMGFHVVYPEAKKVKFYKSKGYKLLAVGLDSIYLGQKCREVLSSIG